MSVLVHVSSMKTRRSGAIRSCRSFHRVLRRATSGRSRSLATTLFFEAELLGVDEVPDRSVVDLETATGEFRDKTSQRKRVVPSDAVWSCPALMDGLGLRRARCLVPAFAGAG